jgi:hypothetical protein
MSDLWDVVTSVMSIDESTSLTFIRYEYSYLRIIYVILPIPRYEYTYLVNVREVLSPEVIVKVKRWRRRDIADYIETLLTTDESHILTLTRYLYVPLEIVREVMIPSIQCN